MISCFILVPNYDGTNYNFFFDEAGINFNNNSKNNRIYEVSQLLKRRQKKTEALKSSKNIYIREK